MAAQRPKNTNPVFGQNETMDDLTAEREELGGGEAASQGPLAQPSEDVSPPTLETTPPDQSVSTDTAPVKETGVDRRIKELLEINREKDRQIAESNERWARLDERGKQVREAQAAAQQAAQTAEKGNPYDKQIDPVGWNSWEQDRRIEALEGQLQQYVQNFQQLQTGFQQSQQANDFNNSVVAEATAYSRQQPDYMDAANHLANWRLKVYQEHGGLNPQDARQLVLAESNFWVNLLRQTGKSFPDVFYKVSQMVGYQPRNGNGNGAVTPAAASQAGKVLAQVAKGQAMQGIGRGTGAGNEARSRYAHMTAAEIAAVPDNVWQRDYANPQMRVEMEAALRRLDGIENDDVRYSTR